MSSDDLNPTGSNEQPAEAPVSEGITLESATAQLFSGQPEATTLVAHVPQVRGRIDRFGVAMGTGRRKTSVARVRVAKGAGKIEINGRTLDDFFCTTKNRNTVQTPLKATETFGTVDVTVNVAGGGTTGQAGAIALGLSRALQALNPSLHATLSGKGLLTRDGRMVERKKYGRRKARRSCQFSKR